MGTRDPDGKIGLKVGGRLLIRQFPDFPGLLATASTDRPGDCEIKWVDGWNGGASTVRTSRRRGPECDLINAGGREGEMGRSLTRPVGLLQFSRETSCVPAVIRERNSPSRS